MTAGTLLGGRVIYDQPQAGYRTGIEPVLLAASIPARPGERVVEAGTGAGAGLLCLCARVPGLSALGIERDPAQAAHARWNAAANSYQGMTVETADITLWRAAAPFDHAFANPPWHDPAGTPSPEPGRLAAKQADHGLLAAWCKSLARALRPRGTLSLILPTCLLGEAMDALRQAKCQEIVTLPLWPRAGQPARLVILRAIRLGRGPCTMLPGLTLHDGAGYTEEAGAILRQGAPLGIAALET